MVNSIERYIIKGTRHDRHVRSRLRWHDSIAKDSVTKNRTER